MTDNITHTLFGLFIGFIIIHYLDFKGNKKWPFIAILLAANAPDIDFVLRAFGAGFYFTNHRIFTHSIFGMIGLALGLALIFAYILKKKQFWKYFALTTIGVIAHVFLDLITSFGTVIFYPFSGARLALSIIPVVDIFVIAIFLIGLWFVKMDPEKRVKIAKATLFIFLIFLIFKTGLHFQAKDATQDLKNYETVEVVPHFFNPFGWKAIVFEEDFYLIADFDLTVGGFNKFQYYPLTPNKKVEASKKSLVVRQFLEFTKAPYAFVNGNTVTWVDLRVLEGNMIGITAYANLDNSLNIKSAGFGI